MDSTDRFSAVAADYHRFRPGYPPAAIDWIEATTGVRPPARTADLGCGTGIFSRLLAARGHDVVGVDPNPAMLAFAADAGGGPIYLRGEATRTGLTAGSIDLVTAAQAFHWFPLEPTLAEIDRILVPGGWTCALWNLRRPSPFNQEYEQLLVDCSTDYESQVSDLLENAPVRLAAAIPGTIATELPWAEPLSWEAMLGRVRSSSYVKNSVADLPDFERRLRDIFERHAAGETVAWALRTVAVAWPRR